MSDLETTQAKLRATPTAGVEAEHSALYRRYFSSGYKGYIQGTIAGGTFYGAIGLAIGAVVGLGVMLTAAPALATLGIAASAPLLLAPVLGVTFGMYGAHAFSSIGTSAAIMADSDEHMEKRRTLLDRLATTQNLAEAQEIANQLQREEAPKPIEQGFHWKPAIVGAALGITIAVAVAALIAFVPAFAASAELFGAAFPFIQGLHALGTAGLITAGAGLGGLSGAIIGIDRGVVRGWMDHTERFVHDNTNTVQAIQERERDIQRLAEAAHAGEPQIAPLPRDASTPNTRISQVASSERLVSLDQAQALAH